ncbi:FAD-binding protein [Apirhabdus apintestini]|nr:FAD-binding protein [Enterobacteriaceae bacterium CA-0114]
MSTYISPKANNFPGLDRGFNQRFKLDDNLSERQGEGVYLVTDAQDIIQTLNNIQKYSPKSGEIKVIAGGHCYENFTFQSAADTDSGARTRFVIDLSNMRGIHEEKINNIDYVVIEPGASNWLIQQTLHSLYGAAVPGGSCYSVCAGGHVAGGGYGLLSRLHGLTVDYLAGVEMVIPDTQNGGFKRRTFTPDADADRLDWACRGGGSGHFGIITKYYFEKRAYLRRLSGRCLSPCRYRGSSLQAAAAAVQQDSARLCRPITMPVTRCRARPSRWGNSPA